MIRDTLNALLRAGDDALAAVRNDPAATVTVQHVRRGAVRMAEHAVVSVRNGPLDRVVVGADTRLVGHAGDRWAGVLDVFARALALRSPTPRTMATWRRHDGEPPALEGPRSFTLRFADDRGALELVAQIFSRSSYESARTSGYDEEVARHYLPRDLSSCPLLERENEVQAALAIAARLELDLSCTIGDDAPIAARGLLLGRQRTAEGTAVVLSLDLDPAQSRDLIGRSVEVRCGLCGRVYAWRSRVVQVGDLPLQRDAALRVIAVPAPRAIEISQRRREFRISPPTALECHIRPAEPPTPLEDEYGFPNRAIPADTLAVALVDLSFSGAGLLGEPGLAEAFAPGDALEFWLHLPGRTDPLRLRAVVRQSAVVLAGRNRRQGRLGLEFQPADEAERRAREAVEHHVMSIERQAACARAAAAERVVV